jgi:hypothetical protein
MKHFPSKLKSFSDYTVYAVFDGTKRVVAVVIQQLYRREVYVPEGLIE